MEEQRKEQERYNCNDGDQQYYPQDNDSNIDLPVKPATGSGDLVNDVAGLEGEEEERSRVKDRRDVELVMDGKTRRLIAADQSKECAGIRDFSLRLRNIWTVWQKYRNKILVLLQMRLDGRNLFGSHGRLFGKHQHGAAISVEFAVGYHDEMAARIGDSQL